MCNITYLPGGVEVPEDEIYNAATWNDDGHGWAIAAATGVMLTGRYMDFDTALDTFKLTRDAYPDAPAMFHSRWATHGTVDSTNVHPFTVGKYAAVAHNGVLPSKFQPSRGSRDAHMSDTAVMAAYWLAGRAQTPGVWTRKERRRIARIIGTGNKLCILSVSPYLPEPRAYLVNAAEGTWDSVTGAWFSSGSYASPFSRKRYGGSMWDWDIDSYEWVKDPVTGVWSRQDIGPAAKAADKCPICNHSEGLKAELGVCTRCDSCLDCFEPMRLCQCKYPGVSESSGESVTEAIERMLD